MAKGSEDIILIENKPFTKKSAMTTLQGKQVEVVHLLPVMNEKEHTTRSAEIENDLYDVFVKYQSGSP